MVADESLCGRGVQRLEAFLTTPFAMEKCCNSMQDGDVQTLTPATTSFPTRAISPLALGAPSGLEPGKARRRRLDVTCTDRAK